MPWFTVPFRQLIKEPVEHAFHGLFLFILF